MEYTSKLLVDFLKKLIFLIAAFEYGKNQHNKKPVMKFYDRL